MIGKLYSSFKINILYGEIDILLCSRVQDKRKNNYKNFEIKKYVR